MPFEDFFSLCVPSVLGGIKPMNQKIEERQRVKKASMERGDFLGVGWSHYPAFVPSSVV